ncbi:hypothetical protein C8J57DRAFT_1652734 [Mycena rebaudengoi]|nr:hypothetical protein C8J57DRAFT_1652734 [Mycena rebaudengoi]
METVVFQVRLTKVENHIFKVPRYQFETHSDIFAATFTLPAGYSSGEGSSDQTPFKLEGVHCADFASFLKVLYPRSVQRFLVEDDCRLNVIAPWCSTAIPKIPDIPNAEWISVLKLATLWRFLEIRDLAIEQLENYTEALASLDRIVLGKKHAVSAWVRSGYTDLVRRQKSITEEEARYIGWELALRIYQAREEAVGGRLGNAVYKTYRALSVLDLFDEEFRLADSESAVYKREILASRGQTPSPQVQGQLTDHTWVY